MQLTHVTVANAYRGYWYTGGTAPSVVSFMVFNSVWSLLVLAYVGLTPLYLTSIFHKLAALVLNVLTTIFWFAGSIALAVQVGGPWNCGSNTYCGSTEAAIAFGFFLWYVLDSICRAARIVHCSNFVTRILFTVLTVVDAMESLRSRGHNAGTHHSAKTPTAYPGA